MNLYWVKVSNGATGALLVAAEGLDAAERLCRQHLYKKRNEVRFEAELVATKTSHATPQVLHTVISSRYTLKEEVWGE
jgi:hydroxymethylpyrimidine/phosphomethylpyrimidine kinase